MSNTRAPIELPARILDFCRAISPEKPAVMAVEPQSFAVPSECYSNMGEQIRRVGGSAMYGWQIWDWPAVFTEAELHAVWRAPDGSLHDVTPKVDGDNAIVSLPEPLRTYQGNRIDSIRRLRPPTRSSVTSFGYARRVSAGSAKNRMALSLLGEMLPSTNHSTLPTNSLWM
jgi:hypothetical protein